MNAKKRLISALTLTLVLGIAGAGTAFALAGDGGSDNPEVPNDTDTAEQVSDGLPSYDEGIPDNGDGKVVTSIDDIDPNVCNAIHNINACTPEELEELGMTSVTGSIVVGEYYPDPNVEAKPEPLFPDGEPQYEVQSHGDAVVQACG